MTASKAVKAKAEIRMLRPLQMAHVFLAVATRKIPWWMLLWAMGMTPSFWLNWPSKSILFDIRSRPWKNTPALGELPDNVQLILAGRGFGPILDHFKGRYFNLGCTCLQRTSLSLPTRYDTGSFGKVLRFSKKGAEQLS